MLDLHLPLLFDCAFFVSSWRASAAFNGQVFSCWINQQVLGEAYSRWHHDAKTAEAKPLPWQSLPPYLCIVLLKGAAER